MTYRVVLDSSYGLSYSEARDKPAGVRGVLCKGMEDLSADAVLEGVLCEAESLDEVMTLANAWRDAHPDKSVYVCDGQNRVVAIVWRTDYSKEQAAEAESARKWFRIGLTSVLLINFVIASAVVFFKARHPIVPAFSTVAALGLVYAGLVKMKMINEIEGIHLTVMLSVLVWGFLSWYL